MSGSHHVDPWLGYVLNTVYSYGLLILNSWKRHRPFSEEKQVTGMIEDVKSVPKEVTEQCGTLHSGV